MNNVKNLKAYSKILPVTMNDIKLGFGYYSGIHLGPGMNDQSDFAKNLYKFLVRLFFIFHQDDNEVLKAFSTETTIGQIRDLAMDPNKEECHFEFEIKNDDFVVYFAPCSSLLSYVDTIYVADIENFSAHLQNKDVFTEYDIISEHNEIAHQRLVEQYSNDYMAIVNEYNKISDIKDIYKKELQKLGVSDENIEKLEWDAAETVGVGTISNSENGKRGFDVSYKTKKRLKSIYSDYYDEY